MYRGASVRGDLGGDMDWDMHPPPALAGGREVHGSYPVLELSIDFAGAEDEEHVLGEDWDM